MTLKDPQHWEVIEDCGALLLARLVDWDGNLLTQAAVNAISYKVFDLSDENKEIASGSLAKGTVIFDSEQSGDNWPYDDGYNFKWMMPATCLPTGGHAYKVEITIDPTSGEDFQIPYWLDAINTIGS